VDPEEEARNAPWWSGFARLFRKVVPEEYFFPMFYNNFEMGTLAHKNAPLYRRWFTTVDTDNVTRGILRYRWGDAPLHTVGLFALENGDTGRLCYVPTEIVAYEHQPVGA
jgi:hypothetical protein